MRSVATACVVGSWLLLIPSGARGQPAPPGDAPVEVHGFVSQGLIKTTSNNYLAESERGSLEFAEAGVNVTKAMSERLRAGVQLFARDLGPLGNYSAKFDWFYLDYRFADWLGIRAGRTKLPFGLYNEVNDIDSARLPILLPQSVYPIGNRDFLLAQTGLELYGYVLLGPAGGIEYRLYGGTIFLEVPNQAGGPLTVDRLDTPYLAGGRLLWEPPVDGLHLGGSVQALRLDADLIFGPAATQPLIDAGALPAGFDGRVSVKLPALLWVTSVEYAAHDLLLAAEYSRWHVDVDSTTPALYPESGSTSERLYGMGAYRLSPRFTVGAYYSLLFPQVSDREGREAQQHDVAATLRFDINANWLLKFEAHYMRGTATLSPALNGGRQAAELDRDWGVLLAKTTAHF